MSLKSDHKCEFMKLASIAPASTEDYSDVRELHKSAISSVGWRFYSLAEVAAKLEAIDQPDYTALMLKENVQLARLRHVLIGSSSWRPSNEHMQTATITHLYVNPLFANGGVATALIEKSEQLAYKSGFRWISALSDFNSRSFFSRLGYEAQGFRGCKITKTTQYPLQIMTRHISSQYAKKQFSANNPLIDTHST
ncbi:MAG: GNAT family N-acetyltransferase [Hyphomicrobiaceae bacterium]|nr:GNAT family N-acetyltransferase [Hyphomicrobiaceae bacterium]